MAQNPDISPKLAAVIGWPISHSLSPLIHSYWANKEHAAAFYSAVAAPPAFEAFKRVVDGLRQAGFSGVNVTLPHKENALRYASKVTPLAQKAGAANMLTFTDQDAIADNSDASGIRAALRAVRNAERTAARVLILGAGGAARGVLAGLHDQYNDITVTNRTMRKAEALADQWQVKIGAWENRNTLLASVDIVINTTSLGMIAKPPLELDYDLLNSQMLVCDIVYSPLQTPLLRAAVARRCQIVDGLTMLMHQAVPGYKAWLGAHALVDDGLRTHLVNALEKRNSL